VLRFLLRFLAASLELVAFLVGTGAAIGLGMAKTSRRKRFLDGDPCAPTEAEIEFLVSQAESDEQEARERAQKVREHMEYLQKRYG